MATNKPRLLNWRFEQVFLAADALLAHGHPVNPRAIRRVFTAAGLFLEDRGNQWIGDILGAHGLNLQRDPKGDYLMPEGGIQPEDMLKWFSLSFGYQFDNRGEKYFPIVAALPHPAGPTAQRPRPPARPDRQGAGPTGAEAALAPAGAAGAVPAEADLVGLVGTVATGPPRSRLYDLLRGVLEELWAVVRLLRKVPAGGPAPAEVEDRLRTAEHLLGAAEGGAAEFPPPTGASPASPGTVPARAEAALAPAGAEPVATGPKLRRLGELAARLRGVLAALRRAARALRAAPAGGPVPRSAEAGLNRAACHLAVAEAVAAEFRPPQADNPV